MRENKKSGKKDGGGKNKKDKTKFV